MFKAKGFESLDYSGIVIQKFPDTKGAVVKMVHDLKGYVPIKYVFDTDIEIGDKLLDLMSSDLLGGPGQVQNETQNKHVVITYLRSNCNEVEAKEIAKQ
jgi:hypothetical protein